MPCGRITLTWICTSVWFSELYMLLCQECKQLISSLLVKKGKLSKDRHVSVSESRLKNGICKRTLVRCRVKRGHLFWKYHREAHKYVFVCMTWMTNGVYGTGTANWILKIERWTVPEAGRTLSTCRLHKLDCSAGTDKKSPCISCAKLFSCLLLRGLHFQVSV